MEGETEQLYPWESAGELPRVPQVQLAVSVGDNPARAVAAAREWYELGFELLGGRLRETVLQSTEAELDWMSREPGATQAAVFAELSGPAGVEEYSATYSAVSWRYLMEKLAEIPILASFEVRTNNELGRPAYPSMGIATQRIADGRDVWLRFYATFGEEFTSSAAGQSAILQFMRAVADGCNPTHGEVSFALGVMRTVLEEGLGVSASETVPRSRGTLRSYGWLTILAEELGRRLGGVSALRGSGAFAEVERLTGGGYWLLATERWQDYGLPQAEKLFEVFAPVLPPGRPKALRRTRNVLVERDPRDVVAHVQPQPEG